MRHTVSRRSLLLDTEGLSTGADGGGTDAGGPELTAAFASCRELHRRGETTSGVYALLAPDGSSFDAYCDMENFDGGWTLVTPAMIVEDKRVQDLDPASPAKVDVTRSKGDHGGAVFTIDVTAQN